MKKILCLLSALVICFLLVACGNQGNDHSPMVQYNKSDLYGQYIDINSGKTLDLSYEEAELTSANKSISHNYSDWNLEGNIVMLSEADSFEIKSEKSGFKLIARGDSKYVSSGEEYVSYSLYYDSLPKFNLGEEAKTDSVKFTLKEIEFAELIDALTYSIKENGSGMVPDDGMVFAYLTYNIENLSKSKIKIVDDVIITIDYDNEYLYSNDSDNFCYYKETSSVLKYSGNNGVGSGTSLYLNPLTSNDYNVAIPCASAIKDDLQKPLKIIVTITTSDGVEGFVYTIR